MSEQLRGWQVLAWIAIGSAILIFVVQAIWLWGFSIDDAGVSWRYAAHLAEGHGLKWNLHEAPVEGYSNFLWVLMLAGLGRLGLEIENAAKILGFVFGLGTFLILGLICRRMWESGRFWWAPLLILALTPQWAMWAMSGLELASVAAFLLLAVFSWSEAGRISKPLLSLGLCGLVLSRPEGIAVALMFLGLWVALPMGDYDWRARVRMVGWPILLTLSTAIALVAFRMWYFGYPLPNTVYAKFSLSMPSWPNVLRWLLFVTPFFAACGVALGNSRDQWMRRVLIISIIVVVGHTIMTLPVSPVMNFDHRYDISFLPLLLLGVPRFLQMVWTRRATAAVALLILLLVWPLQGLPRVREQLTWERDRMESQRCIAEQLLTLPQSPTVALQDAGRIPYWADLSYIDAWGLCDVGFAHGKFTPEELLKRRPNVYVVSADSIAMGRASPRLGMDHVMYSVTGFVDEYRLWKHCVFGKRRPSDAYQYAILLDVFWTMRTGVRLPLTSESAP